MFTLEYAKVFDYYNAEQTAINMVVKWEEFNEETPFLAAAWDPEPHGIDLFNRAKAGEFGEVAPYKPPIEINITQI